MEADLHDQRWKRVGTPHSPRANDGEPRTEEAVRGSRRSIVMTPFLYVLVGLCLSAVVVARVLLARRQEKDRCTFRVVFPREVRAEQVVALLTALSGSVGDTFVIEVSATSEGIVHRLVAPVRSSEFLAYQMRAAIPGVRLLPDESSPTCGSGCELRLTSHTVPLRSDEPAATSTAILASLSAASDAGVVVQWVITPKRHLPLLRVSRNHDPLESLLTDRINGRRTIGAADELRRRMEKAKTPLFHAALRVGIDDQSRMSRAHDVLATLGSARSSGVRFGRRFVPVLLVGERIRERRIPALVWPVLINASELASLAGWPVDSPVIPGLTVGAAPQLPPVSALPKVGLVIGRADFPGMERPVAVGFTDLLRHLYAIGPTGTGKSTLATALVTQQMEAGYGVCVIDPKGDLIEDLLDRIPAGREEDVMSLTRPTPGRSGSTFWTDPRTRTTSPPTRWSASSPVASPPPGDHGRTTSPGPES